MPHRVILTGATSFLGQHIVTELGKYNKEVYAIIRPTSTKKMLYSTLPYVTTIWTDMDQTELWKEKVGHADYFLHLGWDGVGAAGRSNVQIQDKNVQDTLSCIKAASDLGCKAFLFAGSQAEYGPKYGSISETEACNPTICYGAAKLQVWKQANQMTKQRKLLYYHARIFSIYGIGDHPWALVPSCIKTLCDGRVMQMSSGMQFWNYMYATDAAAVLCRLIFSGAESGIYNVASKDTRRLREFTEEIQKNCDGGKIEYGAYIPAEKPVNLIPDIQKLEQTLGKFGMTNFSEATKILINRYRTQGVI